MRLQLMHRTVLERKLWCTMTQNGRNVRMTPEKGMPFALLNAQLSKAETSEECGYTQHIWYLLGAHSAYSYNRYGCKHWCLVTTHDDLITVISCSASYRKKIHSFVAFYGQMFQLYTGWLCETVQGTLLVSGNPLYTPTSYAQYDTRYTGQRTCGVIYWATMGP